MMRDESTERWRHDHDDDPRVIRSRIATTRAEMDRTLDELGDRLHPRSLVNDLLDLFRSPTPGRSRAGRAVQSAGHEVLDVVKSNPLPVALIGAGVAWLIANQRRSGGGGDARSWRIDPETGILVESYGFESFEESAGAEAFGGESFGAEHGPGKLERAKDKASELGGAMKDKASSAAGAMKDAARSAAHRAKSAMGGVKHGISRAGSATKHGMSRAGHGLQRGYANTRDELDVMIHEHPLAAGAGAFAVGILAGLLLPRTRAEDRLMGESADRLKDEAWERGEELVEQGRQVASAAVGAVKEEARREGIDAETLSEKARRIAERAKEGAKIAASEEGLSAGELKEKARHVGETAIEKAKEAGKREHDA